MVFLFFLFFFYREGERIVRCTLIDREIVTFPFSLSVTLYEKTGKEKERKNHKISIKKPAFNLSKYYNMKLIQLFNLRSLSML